MSVTTITGVSLDDLYLGQGEASEIDITNLYSKSELVIPPALSSAVLEIDPEDKGQQLLKVGETIQLSKGGYCQNMDFIITDLITVGDKPKYMLMRAVEANKDDKRNRV